MKFGLIGYPLSHSFSKSYFESKFRQLGLIGFSYQNFPLQHIDDIIPLLGSDLFGLNVTIPYKQQVMKYLDEIDPVASQIRAVNTLVRTGQQKWKGYNTDVTGFKQSLINWFAESPLPLQALVLGSGGVARAIHYVLESLGIRPSFVSREKGYDYTYDELTPGIIEHHKLIVNASPVGMEGNSETQIRIPYDNIGPAHWLFDVVYNPLNTVFLSAGKERGAHTKNGLDMLHLQADTAWSIWKEYGKFG